MSNDHPPTPSPLDDALLDELARLLHEFISAPTFYRKQRLVEGNPLLLETLADSALAGLIVEYADEEHVRRSLELHRALLRRCREIGIREAFAELRRTVEEMDRSAATADQAVHALVETIGEFITATSWEDSRRWLEAHPELLSAQADAVFEELIRTHTARGERNVVRQLVIHRDLLRMAREVGTQAAFERMAGPLGALDVIAENTIAVLTTRPEERARWAEAVHLSRVRAAELDDQPMLTLLRAVSRLLEGEAPAAIAPDLEGEHAACWARIVAALSEGRKDTPS